MTGTEQTVTPPAAARGQAAQRGRAWWFLDTLVVEHPIARPAPDTARDDHTAVGPVVLEVTLPVGASPPLHTEDDEDSFYVLEGLLVVRSGEDRWVAGPGRWVSVSRGVPHTFRVVGDHPARILTVDGDDGFLQMVRDLGGPAPARELPTATGGPGLDVLTRRMTAHGVHTVGTSMSEPEAQAVLAGRTG